MPLRPKNRAMEQPVCTADRSQGLRLTSETSQDSAPAAGINSHGAVLPAGGCLGSAAPGPTHFLFHAGEEAMEPDFTMPALVSRRTAMSMSLPSA